MVYILVSINKVVFFFFFLSTARLAELRNCKKYKTI